MKVKLSELARRALHKAEKESNIMGQPHLLVEYLFSAIIEDTGSMANTIFIELDLPIKEIKEKVLKMASNQSVAFNQSQDEDQLGSLIGISWLETFIFRTEVIMTEHILLAMLSDRESAVSKVLLEYDIEYDHIKHLLETEFYD